MLKSHQKEIIMKSKISFILLLSLMGTNAFAETEKARVSLGEAALGTVVAGAVTATSSNVAVDGIIVAAASSFLMGMYMDMQGIKEMPTYSNGQLLFYVVPKLQQDIVLYDSVGFQSTGLAHSIEFLKSQNKDLSDEDAVEILREQVTNYFANIDE